MTWRLFESLHGHAGILAAIALAHPAIAMRTGRPLSRGMKWSVALTTLVTALAFALGVTIYEPYRNLVKRPLFVENRTLGFLFETKEHLAFMVIAMSLGACVAALIAPPKEKELRRATARVYAAATVLALATAALGTAVSSVRGF